MMQTIGHRLSTFAVLVVIQVISLRAVLTGGVVANDNHQMITISSTNTSNASSFTSRCPVLDANPIDSEDVIFLSSWQTMKYWTSNSALHSSKTIDVLDSVNASNDRKLTAIDFYASEDHCVNVLVWAELTTKTVYTSAIDFTPNQTIQLSQTKPLFTTDFGSHLRLAVNSLNKTIYLALFQFSRIDVFDIERQVISNFLTNVSKPVDIAIDSERQMLFWIENWTCISQTSLTHVNIVKMCSTKARAIAVDPTYGHLYWSDSEGNIMRRSYFQSSAQLVFTAKKMLQNYALDVTNGAIYLSDSYKMTAINKKTFADRVVLIESPGILDFKAIENRCLCQTQRQLSHTKTGLDYSLIPNETLTADVITIRNESLIHSNNDNNNENHVLVNSRLIIIVCILVAISVTTVLVMIIAFNRYSRRRPEMKSRNLMKRMNGSSNKGFVRIRDRNPKRLMGKDRQNVGQSVCIEDLGSFNNSGYLDLQTNCTSCPLRQTCGSCDDKDQCLETGICLNTFKCSQLLTIE